MTRKDAKMEETTLFIAEVRDETGKPKTYRIVRAIDENFAKDFVYYALTDSGIECTRYDIFVYKCIGEE